MLQFLLGLCGIKAAQEIISGGIEDLKKKGKKEKMPSEMTEDEKFEQECNDYGEIMSFMAECNYEDY